MAFFLPFFGLKFYIQLCGDERIMDPVVHGALMKTYLRSGDETSRTGDFDS